MSKCANCGIPLSCGCQKRVAKDGKSCCQKCVAAYDAKTMTTKKSSLPEAPTNVVVTYSGPGQQLR